MSSPVYIHNTTCPIDVEVGLSPSESPMQHANTSTMQLPDSEDPRFRGSGMHHVSIVVTDPFLLLTQRHELDKIQRHP